MAFYIGNTQVIDNSEDFIPGKFTTRANLPTLGVSTGTLAYVVDSSDLAINTSEIEQKGSSPTAADDGVTWYKFLVKPLDYKNEVILSQGTIAGGWTSSAAIYRMEQMYYATDSLTLMIQVLPFLNAFGSNHSTETTAYYHQGGTAGTENLTAKMDWATFSVLGTAARPTCAGGYLNSLQPGPRLQNTFGVLLKGTNSCWIEFATDTWHTGGYNVPATGHGWGSFGSTYGYNWDGSSDLYQLTWAGAAWAASGAGKPPNSTDYGKSLNTKWGKLYSSGGGSASYVDRYTAASNSWASNVSSTSFTWQDQSTLMGQDWGYWLGYYSSGTYPISSWQHHYATETLTTFPVVSSSSYSFNGSLASGASGASSCTGPQP